MRAGGRLNARTPAGGSASGVPAKVRSTPRLLPLLAAALACASGAASAATLSGSDRDFLVSTAQGANYELAVARLALARSTRTDVRRYARTMVADHRALDAQLHAVAEADGVTLPTTMTDEKRQSFDRLNALPRPAFDRAFVAAETSDNQDDVGTEQREIDTAGDARVRTLVQRLQAADRKHARMGEALQQAGR